MPTFMLGKNSRVLHSVSYCLLVFLLLFFFSPFSFSAPTYTGAGTSGSPYQIDTCVELQDMNYHLNDTTVYFELGADINCSNSLNWTKTTGGLKGFSPVGNASTPFKGRFDGNNFTISKLMIYQDVNQRTGLFGSTENAKIKNVGLIDFNVFSTDDITGCLAGQATTTDINNVFAWNGKVTGSDYTGGLVGLLYSSSDMNQVFSKDTYVQNQAGSETTGGITGFNNGSRIWNSYSTAKISSTNADSGGIANGSGAGTTQTYWNTTDSNHADNGVGTVITQAQQKKQASYVNWNFASIWEIVEDTDTPYFIAMPLNVYPPLTPDINFVSIESDLLVPPIQTYAYIIDKNLSIDFNVFVGDNNRFIVDINYGTTNAIGSGSVLVKDLNLTSAICPDQDWNDKPSVCHWDFNVHQNLVVDGNYFLKARIRTSFTSSTKASTQSFLVANDVNIVIAVPIDEETGLAINTISKYTWQVRLYDAGGLQYYPLQKDQNGFMAPLGESIIISIDTNDSTAYYPRQYTLIFNEPTATYTLQPYLIKQSVSGNFIFNVTNISTAAPISGVEIQIFGFIPALDTPNIQTITTDSAGLATIPLRLGSPYTVTFYYLGTLVHSVSITPTTGSLYYQVQLNIAGTTTTPTPADYGGITTTFYPITAYLTQKSNGAVDINVSLSMITKTFSIMRVRVLDTNGCLFDNNVFTGLWTDGNTVVLNDIDLNRTGLTSVLTGSPCVFDEMFSVYMIVDVNSTDGNQFSVHSIKWQLLTEGNYKYNLMYLLPQLAGQINGSNGKMATTFIAFLVLITAISAVGAVSGGEPIMAAMLTLAILGFFMIIGFVDFLPFAFICIATFFGILYMWGRFG